MRRLIFAAMGVVTGLATFTLLIRGVPAARSTPRPAAPSTAPARPKRPRRKTPSKSKNSPS
jgi:hypothetical protein